MNLQEHEIEIKLEASIFFKCPGKLYSLQFALYTYQYQQYYMDHYKHYISQSPTVTISIHKLHNKLSKIKKEAAQN